MDQGIVNIVVLTAAAWYFSLCAVTAVICAVQFNKIILELNQHRFGILHALSHVAVVVVVWFSYTAYFIFTMWKSIFFNGPVHAVANALAPINPDTVQRIMSDVRRRHDRK